MAKVFSIARSSPVQPVKLNYLVDLEKAKRQREFDAGKTAKKARRKARKEAAKVEQQSKPQTKVIRPVAKPQTTPAAKFTPIPYRKGMGREFYSTREWRELRWQVLTEKGAVCCVCGATPKSSGQPVHVDHIKPRYHFPALELVRSNLQVLCADCNIGKGASY